MIKNFPKEHKYALGTDILNLSWNCLDLIVEANAKANDEKKIKIAELSRVYDKLKMRIRMSQEINLISLAQFSHIEENYLLEIGRMIGGWSKWAK